MCLLDINFQYIFPTYLLMVVHNDVPCIYHDKKYTTTVN